MTRAFVVGNIAIDETYRIDEFPREGASIHGRKLSRDLGGKGANQAIILGRAGVETALIAGVGMDSQGDTIRRLMADEAIDRRMVELKQCASDTSLVLTTKEGANAIITTNECAQSLRLADIAARIGDTMCGDWIILQGNLCAEATREVMEMALSRGLKIVLNPSPVDPEYGDLLPRVNVLFVNEVETKALTGVSGVDAVELFHDIGIETVILTRGEESTLAKLDGDLVSVPTTKTVSVDPTGAGDTFLSVAVASAILHGGRIDRHALETAAKAAAITVSRHGTISSFPKSSEMQALLEGN